MPTRQQVEDELEKRGYEPANTEGYGGTYTDNASGERIRLGRSVRFRHPRETERGAIYLHGEVDAVLVPNGPYRTRLNTAGIQESGTKSTGARTEPAWRGRALGRALKVLGHVVAYSLRDLAACPHLIADTWRRRVLLPRNRSNC